MKLVSAMQLSMLAISIAVLASGCGESSSNQAGSDYDLGQSGGDDNSGGTPNIGGSFNQTELITHLANNIMAPTFELFATQAKSQQTAVVDYCAIQASASSTEAEVSQAKSDAQQAWRNTMNVWQQAEVMQIGPLLENNSALRNKIYSWPVVNACAVDQDVVYFANGNINGSPYDITKRTEPRRGLDALEYLLFNENLAHSCSSTTAPSGWDNLTPNQQKIARCNFAIEVANDVSNNGAELVSQWNGANGYAQTLINAGNSDSEFATVHEAINRISDALFYIDSITKDNKLAKPLGFFANSCGAQACPDDVESPYSQNSLANIENNLAALQKLFSGDVSGNTHIGFDDYLTDVGDSDTATKMAADIITAIAASKNYQQSLTQALANDADRVEQTHADIKNVTDQLKTDFIKSLALELPKTSAGDND